MTRVITMPMINANDESAVLSIWAKPDKSFVRKGEVVAVVETTKASFDVESEHDGYLNIFVVSGSQVKIGEAIAGICDHPGEEAQRPSGTESPIEDGGADRSITKKAEITAVKAGLDLKKVQAEIPGSGTITEADIVAYLAERRARASVAGGKDTVDDAYPQTRQQRLLVIGGGLGAVQVLDSLSRIEHQRATAIIDDDAALHGKSIMGVPVLGGQGAIESLFQAGLFDLAVVSVSTSIGFREKMAHKLEQLHIPMANVIDPTARVQRNAVLGVGNVILAFCHVGSCAIVGNGNFLSPYVDIEHHCTIADFCTFGPGVMMSSLVTIGDRVKFGTGVFIEPKLAIGGDSIVGSGAILTRNIPPRSIVKTRVNYVVRPRSESA